jgi:hypothetical protein
VADLNLACKRTVHLVDELGRPEAQVIVRDRLRSRHKPESELDGIEMPEPRDVLEPDEGDVGRVLRLLHFLAPGRLVEPQGVVDRRFAKKCLVERDRILHRELGARADREMGGALGVSEQDPVSEHPAPGADHREIAPDRAVGQDRMASEKPAENSLHESCRFGLAHPPDTCPVEGPWIGFEDPGRASGLVLISVRDERTPFGVLKDKREGVERLRRAHPGELVGPEVHLGLEMLRIAVTEPAVDPVGDHHQIAVAEAALIVDLSLIEEPNAEFGGALLKDQQQGSPRTAAKAVASDAVDSALEMDRNVVPISEFLSDPLVTRKIVPLEIVEGRVREHHAEAERVVATIALEH